MITVVVLNPAIDKIYFIDGFEAGSLNRVRNVVKSAGGKGVNVARVVSILEEKVRVIGFQAGHAGSWLETKIKDLGIETTLIEIEGESRTNNNIIDKLNGRETEVLEIGPCVGSEDINRFFEVFKNALKDTKILVCTGGLPEGVPENIYEGLIHTAKSLGIPTILDAGGKILEKGIQAKPFMIKPNLRELSEFAGRPLKGLDEIIGTCRQVINQGVEIVVASLGKEGACMVRKDTVLHAKVPQVKAVNTIGSGDSMVAGLAAGFTRGYCHEQMLKLGTACAVSNVGYAEIGMVDVESVNKYIREIEVELMDVE